jgi:hypothetical protein
MTKETQVILERWQKLLQINGQNTKQIVLNEITEVLHAAKLKQRENLFGEKVEE